MKLKFGTIGRVMQERKELRVKRRAENAERKKLKDVLATIVPSYFSVDTLVKRGLHITHKMEIDQLILDSKPEAYPVSAAETKMRIRDMVYDVTLLDLCDRLELASARRFVEIVREIEGVSEEDIATMQKKRERNTRIGHFGLMGGVFLGVGVVHLLDPRISYDRLIGVVALVISAVMFYMGRRIYKLNKGKEQTKDKEEPKE